MKVFVTGGTGTIGGPVLRELIEHGHSVTALARSDRSAQTVGDAGATAVRGSIADLDVLRAAAADSDGVIHLAFDHASMDGACSIAQAAQEESDAMRVIGETLVGSDRPFVFASGTPVIEGRPAVESDPTPHLPGPLEERGRAADAVLALASQGVRSSAVRLSRTVHDHGRGGFAGLLTDLARANGVAGYNGDGTQRWPAVHAVDAAVLFRLALESAPGGSVWHAVDDEGVVVRDIAEVIGRRLGLPVEQVSDEAVGALAPVFASDCPASSAFTREALGWTPTHPRLLADLENLQA